MRRRTAWRVRNNPLEIDLFEQSSQTPEATKTDTTETDSTFDPTEPVEMARNDEGNARKRLSDYARPVLQRPVTRIHAPLGRGPILESIPMLWACYLSFMVSLPKIPIDM